MTRADDTRDTLIAAAQRLFLRRGFHGTSVGAVCEEAGLTKGAFFHHFVDKDAAVVAALDAWQAGGAALFDAAPFHALPDPLDRVYAYVDFTAALAAHPDAPLGCLVGSSACELAEESPAVRAAAGAHLGAWAARFAAILAEAKARHAPAAAWSPGEVAEHFVAVFEGAQVLARATADRGQVPRHLAFFRRTLETLFPEKP